jgi:membrane-associated phospholipid phosphatase
MESRPRHIDGMMLFSFPANNLALIRAFALPFGLLAGAMALGLLIFGWTGIVIDAVSWRTLAVIGAIAATLVLAAARLGNETATAAAISVAIFLVIPAPLAILSYATASLGGHLPLADAGLARIDAALGFDWLAAIEWFNAYPSLIWLLGHAYHGTIVPLIYVFVLLNVLGRRDRLVEFMTLFIGTCIAANVLSGFIPAIGAYVHFQPETALRSAISADAGVWHLAHFEALRSGLFTRFSLTAAEGLVTFPSFHTAAALCLPLALRGFGALTAIAWAAALAIIVSTVPIGGHYLIDVIAGAAMTLALHVMMVRAGVGQEALPAPAAVQAVPSAGASASLAR